MSKRKKIFAFFKAMGIVSGSAINVGLFVLSIGLIFFFTASSFKYGEKVAIAEIAERPAREVEVTIPDEASILDVAGILKDAGLISNEYTFVLQATLNGTKNLIMPGTYELNNNMKTGDIMDALQSTTARKESKADHLEVTIPEGLSLGQIAHKFESLDMFTAEEFLEECANGDYPYDFLEQIPEDGDRAGRMEGYLFPDTYFFTLTPNPREVIKKMLNRFDEIFDEDTRASAEARGLTIDQTIIIASIIEKETLINSERPQVADVIYNRMEQNMPLDMVSTVLYALDKRRDRLAPDDLEIDSPYNTFKREGLPPGPISCPGKEAIDAALEPSGTDALWLVTTDETAGTHRFTSSGEEYEYWKVAYGQNY